MTNKLDAQIFPAADRGHTETDWFRSYNTFNFGNYKSESRRSFGALYVWNDDTLAGGRKFRLQVEEASVILIVPVVGAVHYLDTAGNDCLVEAGESVALAVYKGVFVEFSNPFDDALVNFLHGWIRLEKPAAAGPLLTSFSLAENQNELVPLYLPVAGIRFYIGRYGGRKDGFLKTSALDSRTFVFVVQGAFEVQNTLLEARDGLALQGISVLELEALSNDAILTVLELCQ